MRNKLSAVIIDPLKNEHDYSEVSFDNLPDWCEKEFEVEVLTNGNNILSNLNKFRGFDCIITVGDNINVSELNNLPLYIRQKWSHVEEFDAKHIAYLIVNTFILNMDRAKDKDNPLFSVFTCTFNTPTKVIQRLYNSLKNQTYSNWNWWILDDSSTSITSEYLEKMHDPRITVVRNVTNHGNIGFNKHMIAMLCDGDYLVEVDHDDELTTDCLEQLRNCYRESDADFAYSDCLEIIDGKPIDYTDDFSYGQGYYRDEVVDGVPYHHIAISCSNINIKTIRGIHACPNHVRTWKRDFYHKIGGHNTDLSVIDDFEIIIRTFLYGKMAKVNKVLYIQHQGTTKISQRGDTTTSKRVDEIQRMNYVVKWKYEKTIHERILEYGCEDLIWDEERQEANVRMEVPLDKLTNMDYIYNPE